MNRIEIPAGEIAYHPLSYADPTGRIFWWRNELYRGIAAEKAPLYQQLFHSGTAQRLIDKKLAVETEPTDYALDGYALILKHRALPFVSYPDEWCSLMLKDAALTIIDVELELERDGLSLQDAHPWNILFDGCQPLCIDYGSFVPSWTDAIWPPHSEFCRFFLHPLRLMTHGYGHIARCLLRDELGALDTDVEALLHPGVLGFQTKLAVRRFFTASKHRLPIPVRRVVGKWLLSLQSTCVKLSTRHYPSRVEFMQQLRHQVEAIAVPLAPTDWSDYYAGAFPSFTPSAAWSAKHRNVHQVLTELRPPSVLDIGANRGWYALLAAQLGAQVVACDADETCINALYRDAKPKNLPLLPLVLEFHTPQPRPAPFSRGPHTTQRLRCDLVLALGLVHHLVFKRQYRFEDILAGLAAYAQRWLLVEFIPQEDRYVSQWWSEAYAWYTLDQFIQVLRTQFREIRVMPSDPAPRVLILCAR